MDSYKKYLAEQILTGDKVITYRILSRALKVHVNTAKQMLFDFYQWQNERRPGAVHATYLVYGTKKRDGAQPQVQADDDVEMTSSMPEVESLAEIVPVFTLSLVREGQLRAVLEEYEEASSIHIYSLGPHPMTDSALLSDVARQPLGPSTVENATELQKLHGTILNPRVRRRERKGVGAKLATAPPASSDVKPLATIASAIPKVKEEPRTGSQPPVKEASSTAPTAKKSAPVPPLKRAASSGIMQSFAKAATKSKKPEISPSATQGEAEEKESNVNAMSDDGEDDSEVVLKPKSTPQDGAGRKSRKEREEALRRMMDDDEEDEDGYDEEPEAKMDTSEEPAEESPAPEPEKEEPSEIVSASSGDGRRRGKRRVMRKKQIMDEKGYLVTIQEPGWESFSEDEPVSSSKPKLSSSAPTTQSTKAKKGAPRGSQGSITSFFSKK